MDSKQARASVYRLIGYKVVSSDLRSAVLKHYQYGIGITTRPRKNCGPIAVFKTLEDAKRFCFSGEDRIFKCEYSPARRKYLKIDAKDYFLETYGDELPRGTDFAASVTLIEEVDIHGNRI